MDLNGFPRIAGLPSEQHTFTADIAFSQVPAPATRISSHSQPQYHRGSSHCRYLTVKWRTHQDHMKGKRSAFAGCGEAEHLRVRVWNPFDCIKMYASHRC